MAGCGTLLAALVFTTLVSYSYQLRCFECTEVDVSRQVTLKPKNIFMREITDDCGSFDEKLVKECPVNTECCTKVVVSKDGSEAIGHACGTSVQACTIIDGVTTEGLTTSCYSCTTNDCNGAASLAAATSLLAIPFLIAKFY